MGNQESGFTTTQKALKEKRTSIYLSISHENAISREPKENQVKRIESLFKCEKILSQNISSLVLLVYHQNKKKLFALKKLPREKKDSIASFMRELVILEKLKHRNILGLDNVYIDQFAFYISTHYYNGGSLHRKIIKSVKFKEK